MRIIEATVWWQDPSVITEVSTLEEVLAYEIPERRSVGYLVERSKRRVCLAQTQDEHGVQDVLVIPRGLIRKIRTRLCQSE